MHVIRVPLLNANEEELDVLEVYVAEGAAVRAGDLLCAVESTKASAEIEAPVAGFVRRLQLEAGDRVRVGAVVCVLTHTPGEALVEERPAAPQPGQVKATRKAAALAAVEGVALDALGVDGIVKEADVRRFLAARGAPPAQPRPLAPPPLARDASGQALVYGAGGHAKVLIDLIREGYPGIALVGAVADGAAVGGEVLGVPILGGFEVVARLRAEGVTLGVQGIGALTNNGARVGFRQRLLEAGLEVPALVHPRASVEPSASIGAGAQIFAGAVVGSDAVIGANAIVNSGVVVSHDCRVGAHVHLTPGALLAGGVTVGERTVVGMGVTVYLGLAIGADVVITNGAHVMTDVADGVVVRARGGG